MKIQKHVHKHQPTIFLSIQTLKNNKKIILMENIVGHMHYFSILFCFKCISSHLELISFSHFSNFIVHGTVDPLITKTRESTFNFFKAGSSYVALTGFEIRDPHALAFVVLALETCDIMSANETPNEGLVVTLNGRWLNTFSQVIYHYCAKELLRIISVCIS